MRDKALRGLQRYERIYSKGKSKRNSAVIDILLIYHFVDLDLEIAILLVS